MTTEIKVSRKADKVILKTKGVTLTIMDAEEAIQFSQEITCQADKILKSIESKDE